MDKEEDLASVEEFIFNEDVQSVLSSINDNVMDFNILAITGMGNQEIKHSNILGWLMDDSEHGLEYTILDRFLKKVIENKELKALQAYVYLSNKKRDITIYREKNNIDLLIVDEANKIVITIENKVFANERKDGNDGGQLQKYEDNINEKYNKDYDKYFIYLTIDLEEPSKEGWLRANHQMVADVIDEILNTKDTTDKTKLVLESYIDLLKRNGILADTELEDLCKKIWVDDKYKNALDILMKHKTSRMKIFYDETLREKLNFAENSYYIELDGIKELYKSVNKEWNDDEDVIFEITCEYYDDYVGLYYVYGTSEKLQNEYIQNILKNVVGKNPAKYYYTIKEYKTINGMREDAILNDIEIEINKINDSLKEELTKYKE